MQKLPPMFFQNSSVYRGKELEVAEIIDQEFLEPLEIRIISGKAITEHYEDFFMNEDCKLALAKGHYVVGFSYRNCDFTFESRTKTGKFIEFEDLGEEIYRQHKFANQCRASYIEAEFKKKQKPYVHIESKIPLPEGENSMEPVKTLMEKYGNFLEIKEGDAEEKKNFEKGIKAITNDRSFFSDEISDELWEKLEKTANATIDY
jgi:hypothetical protein